MKRFMKQFLHGPSDPGILPILAGCVMLVIAVSILLMRGAPQRSSMDHHERQNIACDARGFVYVQTFDGYACIDAKVRP